MSDTVIIFTALFSLISAMFTAWLSYLVFKLNKKQTEVGANVLKIEEATNSMKDALVTATRIAATAEGELKGRADEKSEAAKRELG